MKKNLARIAFYAKKIIIILTIASQNAKRRKMYNHFEKDYWYQLNEEASFFKKNEILDQLFCYAFSTHQESKDIWYLDSSCSNHMTYNKSCFFKLDEYMKSQVTFSDEKFKKVEGKGIIVIKTKNNGQK